MSDDNTEPTNINRRNMLKAAGGGALNVPFLVDRQDKLPFQTQDGLDVTLAQIDISNFPDIDLYVGIEDGGNVVGNLSESNFTIEEQRDSEASPRTEDITNLVQPDDTTTANVSASIVIDRSNSMNTGTRIEDARQGAVEFVNKLQSGDEGQVIAYSSDVEIKERWTENTSALTDTIEDITAGGSTSLFDAVLKSIEETTDRLRPSATVVLADGQENDSTRTNDIQDVIDKANEENIPVYTIGLGDALDPSNLQQLANDTGGEYYESADGDDLGEIYQKISNAITSQYVISYQTSDETTDGEERTVTVTAEDGSDSGSDTGTYFEPCAPLPTAIFDIPDTVVTGKEVSFDGSDSRPNGGAIGTYAWDFENDGVDDATGETVTHVYNDPGDYTARLTVSKDCPGNAKAQDISEESLVVLDNEVELYVDGTNSPVTEGETLTVDVTVENLSSDIKDLTVTLLDFDGEAIVGAAKPVQVGGGDNESVTLEWDTEPGDAGSGDIIITDGDRELFETVEILPGLNVDSAVVDIDPYPVESGDTPSVTAEIDEGDSVTLNYLYRNGSGQISMKETSQGVWTTESNLPAVATGGSWVDLSITVEGGGKTTEINELEIDTPSGWETADFLIEGTDLGYYVFETVVDVGVAFGRFQGANLLDNPNLLDPWKRAKKLDTNRYYGSTRGLRGAIGFNLQFFENNGNGYEINSRSHYEDGFLPVNSIKSLMVDLQGEFSDVESKNPTDFDLFVGTNRGNTVSDNAIGLQLSNNPLGADWMYSPIISEDPTVVASSAPYGAPDYHKALHVWLHELGHACGLEHPSEHGNMEEKDLMVGDPGPAAGLWERIKKGTNDDSLMPISPLSTVSLLPETFSIDTAASVQNNAGDQIRLEEIDFNDIGLGWQQEKIESLHRIASGGDVKAITHTESGVIQDTEHKFVFEARPDIEDAFEISYPDIDDVSDDNGSKIVWGSDNGGVVIYHWEEGLISPSYNLVTDSEQVPYLLSDEKIIQEKISWQDEAFIEFRLAEATGEGDPNTFAADVEFRVQSGDSNTQVISLNDTSETPLDDTTSLCLSEQSLTIPSLNLKAVDSQGRMVGVNDNGEYVNEIPGARASGKRPQGMEWISVPKDIDVEFSVSSEDVEAFINEAEELGLLDESENAVNATSVTELQDEMTTEYEIAETRYGDDPQIDDEGEKIVVTDASTRASSNEISPGDEDTDATPSNDQGNIDIVSINTDADNLVDERVILINEGTGTLSLKDWELENDDGDTFVFPDVEIDPGAELTVRTGQGADTDSTVYWNADEQKWSETGGYLRVFADDDTTELEVTFDERERIIYGIEESESGIGQYTNQAGIVDTSGLRDAIDDWQNGDIETTLLRDVIDAWQSGEEVA